MLRPRLADSAVDISNACRPPGAQAREVRKLRPKADGLCPEKGKY